MSLFDKLTPKKARMVSKIARSGCNFLSGTISPVKADPETNTLESIEMGFNHYRKRGVTELILQPKYMGSRCQLYIFPDEPERCYAISRNGFRIGFLDLSKVFEERIEFWKKRHQKFVIEDGELMPWAAMGRGLIDQAFVKFSNLYKRNFEILKSLNWNDNYGLVDEEMKIFDRQIELYGQDSEIKFMPFNILKIGDVICMDRNYANYDLIGKDEYLVIDLDIAYEASLENYLYWIEKDELEGVVIKPLIHDTAKGAAPMLKFRNERYLSIIYGPDYKRPDKLAELIRKKSVGRKIGSSVKQYEIGRSLLKIPIESIHKDNPNYQNLIVQALFSYQRDEETLDPRL